MRTVAAVVFCLSLLASSASAQIQYIDHRTYPADFAALDPGDVVADRPGYVWRHDGRGWYHELAGTPMPGLPPAPPPPTPQPRDCRTVDPYAEPLLAWVCAIEETYRRGDMPTSFVRMNGIVAEPVLPIVGREYLHHYPDLGRIAVLALGLTSSTPQRLVVTYEYLAGERLGEIGSFVNGQGPALWKELPHP
jgi:hypothetical protein